MTSTLAAVVRRDRLESASLYSFLSFVASVQVSIAAAGILLTLTLACWTVWLALYRERIQVPAMFWPLLAYAGASLVAAFFSLGLGTSIVDSKQLVLFLIVPLVYSLARGPRAMTVVNVIITVGAASAVYGIVQYGVLEYDHLNRRPQGALGHYMTYSGLLMLVACAATARVLFRRQDRTWAGLVMPALIVALALTFTRSAWVGTCVAVAFLLALKDFRLVAILPILAALTFGLAPARITDRMYSMFDLQDPTNRDRVAMLGAGVAMVQDHPLTGVGPDMVKTVYPDYRRAEAVEEVNPHLHNVPMHIAAERGLPALAIWIWFIAAVFRDLFRKLRTSAYPSLAAGGLAAVVAMLAAGMFEYNFGDSEFLMLFLVLISLPYAADRGPARHPLSGS
jgi:O-antigen ligase